MTADLVSQLERYTAAVVDQQAPITAAEAQALVGAIRELPDVPQRNITPPRRGIVVAAAAAVVILLLVGAVTWLVGGASDVEPADEPPPTTLPEDQQSTTIPTTTDAPRVMDISGFAPNVSGIGVGASGFPAFTLDTHDYQVGESVFSVRSASWGIDWRETVKAAVDEETALRIASDEVGPEWDAATRRLRLHSFETDETFGELRLAFSGSDNDWTVDIFDVASDSHIGTIEGSLPGRSEAEILDQVASYFGISNWFFVSEGEEHVQVTPPWASYLEQRERSEFIVVEEMILAFVVTDPLGPGQMTIWSSTDGKEWNELGPAPWNGERYDLDTLTVIEGALYVLVFDFDGFDEGVWLEQYWTSPDGSTWTELSLDEWDQQTGGMKSQAFEDQFDREPDDSLLEYLDAVLPLATPVSDDPATVQLAPGPEPLFDTSQLGLEVPLIPTSSEIDWNQRFADDPIFHEAGPETLPADPIMHVGALESLSESPLLVWMTENSGFCQTMWMMWGECGSHPPFGSDNAAVRLESMPDEPGRSVVLVQAPLEASVVVLNGGKRRGAVATTGRRLGAVSRHGGGNDEIHAAGVWRDRRNHRGRRAISSLDHGPQERLNSSGVALARPRRFVGK